MGLYDYRIGEVKTMNCGAEAKIIKYIDSRNITVMFLKTGEIVNATYFNFTKGSIKSHFSPTVYGVGISGILSKGESRSYCYRLWINIMTRCFNEDYKNTRPTYENVTICEEWKYYKNFKEWFLCNYYEIENEKVHLDKDILIKGNKIYSPETCVFVPQRINNLFTKADSRRGEFPIGVSKSSSIEGFLSTVSVKGKNISKYFESEEEAFQDYKIRKETEIRRLAEEYKELIPKKLYEALYSWNVEKDD